MIELSFVLGSRSLKRLHFKIVRLIDLTPGDTAVNKQLRYGDIRRSEAALLQHLKSYPDDASFDCR